MRRIKLFSFVQAMLLSVSVQAQQPKPQLTNLSLQDCIQMALTNHQSLNISDAMIEMAEAQYKQAMSAYWPHLSIDSQAVHANHNYTFTFQGDIALPPAMTGALQTEGNAIGTLLKSEITALTPTAQGVGPQAQAAQQSIQALGAQASALQAGLAKPITSIPMNMNVKLFNQDTLTSSINLTYPIFTGGKISALKNQAEKGVSIAQESRRKTELEVIRDVKKYYYGAQFAYQMEHLAEDTLERFKVLDELTERLFQHGSMKVKKTDYLRAKTTTALTRSIFQEAQYARELAYQALTNAMGLNWDNSISISTDNGAYQMPVELAGLVKAAQQFNPDIQQLKLAIDASDSKVSEAYSGYYPAIGFQGSAYDVQNGYNSGLTNSNNRDAWTVGIGLHWNLFDGFETSGKVSYANAMKNKLASQQILLDQGMALLVKQQFLRLKSADLQIKSTEEATGYATENRKLHVRAYQEEMVKTKDVIESQIVETFAQSAAYRSRYELYLALSTLEFLVGSNIKELN